MSRRPVTRRDVRRAITVVALWLTAMSLSGQAYAQPKEATSAAAENFVRTELETGLSILNNHKTPEPQRRADLRTFLESFMDIPRVALFSLGFARRSASPQQIERFVDVFRVYVVADFESLLTNYYSGQAVRATDCTQDGPNSYTVDVVLEGRAGDAENSNQPIELNVRVLNENGKFVITDLAAMGVWLSVHERDQVNQYLMDSNGNFTGLLTRYRLRAERKQDELPGATEESK